MIRATPSALPTGPQDGPDILPQGVRRLGQVRVADERGTLLALGEGLLPFAPVRIFLVEGPPGGATRGGHAHRSNRQILACVAGEVRICFRSGAGPVTLRPGEGLLLIEPGVWTTQHYRGPDDRLLVMASEPWSPESYLTE